MGGVAWVGLSYLITRATLLVSTVILARALSPTDFGVYAAARHNRPGDVGVMVASQLGLAIPNFWFAILLILLFAVRLQWVSAGGFPGWEGTSITWEIVPAKDGGQEVRFSHAGWPESVPPAELASVNYTWGRVVGRLKKHVETGESVPFFA